MANRYLDAQLAVYRHLLARHAQDPTFRFSLRRAFSKTPTAAQGLFTGTAKSRYFAFTLWHVPLGYPGAAQELISYFIKLAPDDTFRLSADVLVPREVPADGGTEWHPNTAASRDLVWELQRQPWPAGVEWVAAPAANKMLELTYRAAKNLPDIPALLAALDYLLAATRPGIDAAVAAHAVATPGWVGHPFAGGQFEQMRQRAEAKCADLLAGHYPPEPLTRQYWTTQLQADPDTWLRFRQQGEVRPLFGKLFATETGDSGKLLPQARPGDVVLVTHGPRRVLGVGVLTGRFATDAAGAYCPTEWLLTTPVELAGTPFNTGQSLWNRTTQWEAVRAAYADVAPADLAQLEAVLAGQPQLTGAAEDEPEDTEELPEPAAYWWLNINPAFWKVTDFEVGQEQTYTSHNEKGNKRNVYAHFQKVQPGDLVIGYETTPTKRIRVILEIAKGLHTPEDGEELIIFRVKEFVREEITLKQLQEMPELAEAAPLKGSQGSLFKLTPAEYTTIEKRALRIEAPPLPTYTLADAEQDLFLTTAEIQHLQTALKRKKNLIVQGPPGVGKTYVARRLAWLQMGEKDDNRVQLVQFHQSYSYEDFIRGWRPTAGGTFELANGVFVDFVRRAQHDQAHEYFFLIDEINRGNLSKIFGELLLLLEADKRDPQYAMPLTYRKEGEAPFYLPPNLFVIGTMNTADRSLALVDYALRRRFTFVELEPHLDGKLAAYLQHAGVPAGLAGTLLARVQQLNQQIGEDRNLGAGFQIGHSYFCVPLAGETPEAWWQAIVAHDLAPLLREYWFDDPKGKKAASAVAALLGQTPAA
ncbi:MAG: AAA family ATPase [Janthinobacterium lividum]